MGKRSRYLDRLFKFFNRHRRYHRADPARGSSRRIGRRLRFESLEGRDLLATLVVTTASDAVGHVGESLRDAVAAADTDCKNNISDTITFDPSLNGQTITLTQGQLSLGYSLSTTPIMIDGAKQITISGGNTTNIFSNVSNSVLTLNGLTLTNGNSSGGGAIQNSGNLTVTNCALTNNNGGTGSGGAINSGVFATLTVTNCTVTGNTAASAGGIYGNGTVTISNSTISNNTATNGTGGGLELPGTSTLSTVIITGNSDTSTGNAAGGGVNFSSFPTATMTNCTVSGNSAIGGSASGGGIYSGDTLTVNNSSINNNTSSGYGGGITIYIGNLKLNNDTVSGNTATGATLSSGAASGGGIYQYGVGGTTVSDSTVSGNTAGSTTVVGNGGGIENQLADLTVYDSTVSGNTASLTGQGGGVDVEFSATISNSTISGNTAGNQGGGVYVNGASGLVTSNATISNNTCTNTTSTTASGFTTSSPFVTLLDTIIAGNTGTAASPDADSEVWSIAGSSNLIGIGGLLKGITNGNNGNQVGTAASPINPLLGPLANNGGSTQTMALETGSPAVNQGGPLTTLSSAILSTDTTLSVPIASAIASSSGNYVIQIDNEQMDVTSVNSSANTLTVIRGYNGTTATSHSVGALVFFPTDQRGDARVGNDDIGAYEYGTAGTTLQSPNVTSTTTPENTQSTSGLVITPNAADTSSVTNFQIAGITGGALFLSDGVTSVASGSFITVAQGAAGLKFTPTSNSTVSGSFTVQESTTASVVGLGGSAVQATITVTAAPHAATVTNATTQENIQSTAGLVITPNVGDTGIATNFQIAGISGGSLFLNDGTTPVTNGSFITTADGAAGLKFTPTNNSMTAGSFTVQESTTASTVGLLGSTVRAQITVTPPILAPTVSTATTPENTQTASSLVITANALDVGFVNDFQITGITGGLLFLRDGVTPVDNGQFVSVGEGTAGLKFTPTPNSVAGGSFTVQAASSASAAGLGGPTAQATITVTPVLHVPSVTNTTTLEGTQSSSGLVVTPNALDSGITTDFQITAIAGGSLFLSDGATAVPAGSFITTQEAATGLTFTPTANSIASGHFTIQGSTSATAAGLSGPTTQATITVTPVFHVPTVTNATTLEGVQSTSGLVITPNINDTVTVTYFQITGITGGSLYLKDGVTAVSNGSFITAAQGAAGLKFTPTNNSTTPGSFTVQDSTNASAAGVGGPTAQATITITPVVHVPSVTNATTLENTQSNTGLVITPNALDTGLVTNFQITGITGGSLFLSDGVTPVKNGNFITLNEGAAGLLFTPTSNSFAAGSITVQASTSNSAAGLGGSTVNATITVTPVGNFPNVTDSTAFEDTQSTSGLVITPNATDVSFVNDFQITGITGGSLFLNDGVTAINNGSFITTAQGAVGLKFTPTTDSIASGSFNVQESTNATPAGLSGPTAEASILVIEVSPSVIVSDNGGTYNGLATIATATANNEASLEGVSPQLTFYAGPNVTSSPLPNAPVNVGTYTVVASFPGSADYLAAHSTPVTFSITTATLTVTVNNASKNYGDANPSFSGTVVGTASGDGISVTYNTVATSSSPVQAGGYPITATLNDPNGKLSNYKPTIVDGTLTISQAPLTVTADNASRLVGAADPTFTATISGFVNGETLATSGVTGFPNLVSNESSSSPAGTYTITPTQGTLAAANYDFSVFNPGTLTVASVIVLHAPSVTGTTTLENAQSTTGLVITPNAADTGLVTYFQITGITGGSLFLNDGVTPITNGQFITVAQGAAGLKFTPGNNVVAPGSFTVQSSTTASAGGLGGSPVAAAITITQAPFPWHNYIQPLAVNGGGIIAPIDALIIIDEINFPTITDSTGKLPSLRPTTGAQNLCDVNGDGYVSSLDVLMVIDYLNSARSGAVPSFASPLANGISSGSTVSTANLTSNDPAASTLLPSANLLSAVNALQSTPSLSANATTNQSSTNLPTLNDRWLLNIPGIGKSSFASSNGQNTNPASRPTSSLEDTINAIAGAVAKRTVS